MRLHKITIFLLVLINLTGCKNPSAEQDQTEPIAPQNAETNYKPITITSDSAQITISCVGKIALPPQGIIDVNSPIAANIHNISVLPGSYVKKGQLLASLQNRRIISIQSEFIALDQKLQGLENDYLRKKGLVVDGSVSSKEFQLAESLYKESKAIYQGLSQELLYMGLSPESIRRDGIKLSIPLKAPKSGTIQRVNVHEGQFVDENYTLVTILNPDVLHADMEVFGRDVPYVKEGQEVEISISGVNQPILARLHLIAAGVDPESNSLNVHADIKVSHFPDIKPGMSITGKIKAGKRIRYWINADDVLLVNNEAFAKNKEKTLLQIGTFENGKFELLNPTDLMD